MAGTRKRRLPGADSASNRGLNWSYTYGTNPGFIPSSGGDDVEGDRELDLGVELEPHLVQADRLDRRPELDVAALDVTPVNLVMPSTTSAAPTEP
jgi:hypothetical protein